MGYTALGKNSMLNLLGRRFPGGAVTATAATNNFSRTTHGLQLGDVLVFHTLTGGAGLTAGQIYYVVNVIDANTFRISATPAGTELDVTTDLTAGTLIKIGTAISHTGLYTRSAVRSPTADAGTDTFTDTAHGYSNGDILVFDSITGGSGLIAGRVYFVVGGAANTYQLALTPGGAAVNFTTNVTAAQVRRYTEISGGSPTYARQPINYNDASDGSIDDSTNGAVFDVPAGAVVSAVGYHTALSGGPLLGLDGVTEETFGAQGTYTLTDSDLDLNQGDSL